MSGVSAERGAPPGAERGAPPGAEWSSPPSATKRLRESWIIDVQKVHRAGTAAAAAAARMEEACVTQTGRGRQEERRAGEGGRGLCDRVPDADILEFFLNLLKISDPYSVFLLLH